jgi:uncharacterized protein (TIGR02597 family)
MFSGPWVVLQHRFTRQILAVLAIALYTVVDARGDRTGVPEIGADAITRTSAAINADSEKVKSNNGHQHGNKLPNFPTQIDVEVPYPNSDISTNGALPAPTFEFNPNIATPTLNFTGATVSDCSGYPPDTMGAIGPTQFIVALNGRIRSFNKSTGAADGGINADTDVFYGPVITPGSNFTTDPRIRYDRLSKRWFIIMIDVPGQQGNLPNRVMLAVSDTSVITPSTVWSFFQFQAETTDFADYPTLGIDANALYVGCNIFSTSTGSFVDTSGYVIRKSSVLGAGPIVVTKFTALTGGQVSGPYTPQGVDNYDPTSTEGYFIGVDFTSATTIQLLRVSNPGGTPTLSANVPITVGTFRPPTAVTAQGSTFKIDGLDERLLAAHMRNGAIWTAHNVGLNSTGGNSTNPSRNGVRWYQITNIISGHAPSVVQSGTVFQGGSPALSYWMGTIMVSGQGHAAMGFSVGGTSHFLDAALCGRYATDTLGTMQSVITYTSSSSGYNPSDGASGSTPHRWGDYSMTSVDPNDDMTMWTVQEWCASSPNGFAVQIAKIPAPPPATPSSCSPSAIAAGTSANIIVTGTSSSASGFFDPGPSFSNHIAAVVNGGGVTVNSVTYTDPTHVTINVTVVPGALSGTRTITITNPDGQSVTSSALLTVNGVSATKLTIQIQPSSTATAGVPFAVQPVIRLEDVSGNLVTNDNSTVVTATRSAGVGTLQGSTSVTAVNGLVTFTNLSHRYANNITLAFTSGSLASATSSVVTVAPAAFSQLQILVPGQAATPTVSPGRTGTPTAHVSGTPFNVTVNAVDAFWNFVNTATDTVGLSSSDSIASIPPNTSLVSGTVTLPVTLKTVGSPNLAASDISSGGIGIDVSPGISITPSTLTVVANNAARVYGQTNPVFTGTLNGVQSGDNITATFSSSAGPASAKGAYAIVPTLSDPNSRLGNYTVLSTNGTLTITAASLSVTANNASRAWGAPNPTLDGTIAGLQNNDNVSANYSTIATTNSNVGSYSITLTLADPSSKLSNYVVTTNNGTLTVFDSTPTISAVSDQFVSVGNTVGFTVSASDPDAPYQTLSFSLYPGAPSGATIGGTTGAFSWTAFLGAEGSTNPVTVRVTDNAVPSQSATMTFNIVVVDRPKLLAMNHNQDGSVTMQWSTAIGSVYRLQYKNFITDSNWTDLAEMTASNSTTFVSDTPTQPRIYQFVTSFNASDPAGVMPLAFPGNSDSYVSIPFTRPIADSRPIGSISGNVVTLANASWAPSQFVYAAGVQSNSYYARFDSGALEGRSYEIVSNDVNTVTIALGADSLAAAVAGDMVSIIPHWTLNSVFPNGDGVLASPSPGNRFTEILFADTVSDGINLSSSKIYFFNGSIWKQVGQGAVNHGDDVVPDRSHFVARQNVGSNSVMTALGSVIVTKLALPLRAQSSAEQDNALGLMRSSPVSLNSSGLINSGAFQPSPLPGTRTDELLIFDNGAIAKNKSSSAVYYYWNSAWRRVGAGTNDVGADAVFTPGSGFIIRKATNTTSAVWLNAP